jgi:hypothetical protein
MSKMGEFVLWAEENYPDASYEEVAELYREYLKKQKQEDTDEA